MNPIVAYLMIPMERITLLLLNRRFERASRTRGFCEENCGRTAKAKVENDLGSQAFRSVQNCDPLHSRGEKSRHNE